MEIATVASAYFSGLYLEVALTVTSPSKYAVTTPVFASTDAIFVSSTIDHVTSLLSISGVNTGTSLTVPLATSITASATEKSNSVSAAVAGNVLTTVSVPSSLRTALSTACPLTVASSIAIKKLENSGPYKNVQKN